MNIELRYFTGTGNSWKAIDIAKEEFEKAGHFVHLSKLDPEEHTIDADLIGFAFPVYSFGMPHIIREYVKSLLKKESKQKVFMIITSGDVRGSSSTAKKCVQLLEKKNFEPVYSEVIKMPHNWITFSTASPAEENAITLKEAELRIRDIVKDILSGVQSFHDVRQTPSVLRALGNTVNALFRSAGRKKLMQWYRVYDTCDGCGLCADACPTNCIEIKEGKPVWTGSCEQCMRCVCICPQESIYQKMGDTKGKQRYFAPGFEPLDM